jgi:MFS family permease
MDLVLEINGDEKRVTTSGSDDNSIRGADNMNSDYEKSPSSHPTPRPSPTLHPTTLDLPNSPPPPSEPQPLISPVPEGGLDAWLQVLGSWVALAATWGLVNTFGVFQAYYEKELLSDCTPSQISWIGSLQAALLMTIGPISGPLYDAGYFREVLWVGLFLIIFGKFMLSLCTTYWQVLLAQGVCIGLGCGLVFLPGTAILSQYFQKRRAFVIGLSSTGSPIAGMIFPIIFGRLEPVVGFGWTTRIMAFILLGLSVIPVIFMHTRLPPPPKLRSLIDWSALRDVSFLLVACGSFFTFLTLYVAFFYIQLFASKFQLATDEFSPYLVTLLSAGSIVGRIGPNYIADKIGPLNIWLSCTIISAILMYVMLGIRTLGGLITFAALYGLFSGGLVSVAPSAIVSLTKDMTRVGTRMGMIFFSSGVSILIGTPIAGAILGKATDLEWQATIGYASAGLTIGALGFAGARFFIFKDTKNWKA